MARKEADNFTASNVFEGMVSISALIDAMGDPDGFNTRRIERILFDAGKAESKSRVLAFLRHRSDEFGFPIDLVPLEEIERHTTGSTHGGVIALCTERTFPDLTDEAVAAMKQNAAKGFAVMVEGIEDPYNFGYAFRSLYAAGVDAVILSPRNWMSAAGIVCRASAGASERLPIYLAAPEDAADIFRRHGFRVLAADTQNAVPFREADVSLPLLLVVGGEKRGISKPLLEKADQVVCLEYGRDFPQALSAASAASILAFSILDRNR